MRLITVTIGSFVIAAIFFPFLGMAVLVMAILAFLAIVVNLFFGRGGFESVKTRTVTTDGWTKTTTTRWRNGKLVSAEFTEGAS